MNMKRRFCVAALCLAAVACCSCRKESPEPARVTVGAHSWTVELAVDEAQQYRGLSDRSSLPEDAGMLFIFPEPRVQTFCMRKCLIPLDIAFIDSQLRIVKIHTMTVEPYGQEVNRYTSQSPAQYALEVNAGNFSRLGVHEGDAVRFSGPAAQAGR